MTVCQVIGQSFTSFSRSRCIKTKSVQSLMLIFFEKQLRSGYKSLSPASMLQRRTLAFCVEAGISMQRSDTPSAEYMLLISGSPSIKGAGALPP